MDFTPVNRKGSAFSLAVLRYVFLNTPIPGIGDASGLLGSSLEGSLYISAHYGWRLSDQGFPVIAQNTFEYPVTISAQTLWSNYARVAVPRNSTYWEISGTRIRNKLDITFPALGPTRLIAPGWRIDPLGIGIGTASTGAGKLLYTIPCLLQTPSCNLPTAVDGTILTFDPLEQLVIRAGNLCTIEV